MRTSLRPAMHHHRTGCRGAALAVVLAAGLLVAAGCGGDDDDGGGSTVTATDGRVTVDAEDTQYDVGTIDAEAGPLDVTLVQRGSLDHTFVVEDADEKTIGDRLAVSSDTDEASGTYELQPGNYAFFCDVPGHRAQGMEGRIVVE